MLMSINPVSSQASPVCRRRGCCAGRGRDLQLALPVCFCSTHVDGFTYSPTKHDDMSGGGVLQC